MMNTNLPDNWKIVHVDDICLINKNTLSEKSADFQFKYIDLSSVKNGKILCSAPISFKESPSRARRIIRKNDIIMSTVRPNLQGFAHIDFDAQEYICSTGFAVLTVKPNTSSKFIYYCLYSKSVETQINNMLVGSNYPAINSSDVASLKILLPPLPEQEKIAGILSCWDDGIEKLSALIEKKKIQKKALMQQLLTGKHRLKGFSSPWHEVKLGELCNITTGKLDANAMVENGKYVFFTCARETFLIDTFAFDEEALLISGNGANVGYIHYYNGKFNAYQRTYVLTKFIQNIFFIKYYLDKFLSMRIEKEKKAGNTPYIVLDTLTKMGLYIPSDIAEQKAIAEILSKADEEIELLNKKLEVFKQEKKALMQQLLTGKIRVKVN